MRNKQNEVCTGWDHSECKGTSYCPPRCPKFLSSKNIDYICRPYRVDDRESLLSMYNGIEDQNRAQGLPPKSDKELSAWVDELIENGWNIVAIKDDQVVGHVSTTPVATSEPEIIIFVRNEFQNEGIGTELLKQIVAYALEGNYENLNLYVSKTNSAALSVYKDLGFELVDESGFIVEMKYSIGNSENLQFLRAPGDRRKPEH